MPEVQGKELGTIRGKSMYATRGRCFGGETPPKRMDAQAMYYVFGRKYMLL